MDNLKMIKNSINVFFVFQGFKFNQEIQKFRDLSQTPSTLIYEESALIRIMVIYLKRILRSYLMFPLLAWPCGQVGRKFPRSLYHKDNQICSYMCIVLNLDIFGSYYEAKFDKPKIRFSPKKFV